MKHLLNLIMYFLILSSCQNYDKNSHNSFEIDSSLLVKAILTDSTLTSDYLNHYYKIGVPISIKSMALIKSVKQGKFHTNYSSGNYTEKDTLYIFSGIKNYTPTSSRIEISIPSEGVRARLFLKKINSKWEVIRDSTSVDET